MANQRASYLAEERSRCAANLHPPPGKLVDRDGKVRTVPRHVSQVFHLHQRYCTGRQRHGALRDEVATRCILHPLWENTLGLLISQLYTLLLCVFVLDVFLVPARPV